MKRFIFLLTSLLVTTFLSGQKLIANEYPAWGQPVIKRLIAKDPTVTGYGVKDNSKFINTAILDKKSKMLYWISCEGYIIEASQLTDPDYRLIISKKVDPFQLYQLLYKKDLQITDNAIAKLRFPKNKFYSRADPHYDQYLTELINTKRFDTLKTPVQKMVALYKDEQNYLYHLNYARIGHPLKIKPDSIYKAILSQVSRGSIKVSEHTDCIGTAEFYNKDALSPIYKAVLNIPSATLYFYQKDLLVFDSISINRNQILKLIDEGTDVFTLYQNYTLWQLCMLDESIKQIHDYYAKIKTSRKEKQAAQYLLAGFGESKEALVDKLKQLEEKTLLKLKELFDVDKNYLEQGLWSSFKYSTVPVRYGEYTEGKGLVLSDPVPTYISPVVYTQTRGNKLYELTDQRGNVMVVISDKKVQHDDNGDKIVDYNTVDVVKATDYSSFGAPLPGRTLEIRGYKYGYNGKENDVETGYQNYGFRMYDPNIARFISVDPLTGKYPWYSPYQFAGNKPIAFTDLDGMEENSTSTFVYHSPALSLKPTFKGVISFTDARAQQVHKTFEGNFAQLAKTYPSTKNLVNALVGSNIGNGSSKLGIIITGSRSDISKSWKGTDKNYYTQFSYSFTSNNVTETGTFELKSASIQVSARAWDPFVFPLVNKLVSSIIVSGIGKVAASSEEMVTLYRSISKSEAESIQSTRGLSLGEGGMEVKQFWQTKEGLNKFNNSAGFSGEYNLEMTVPKSLLGKEKAINTATQVDEFYGPSATIDASQLNTVNQNVQSFKITPIKK